MVLLLGLHLSLIHIYSKIGKVSFGTDKLLDNFYVFMDAIIRAKPPAAKGQYIRSVTVSPSMGPGVPISLSRLTRPQNA